MGGCYTYDKGRARQKSCDCFHYVYSWFCSENLAASQDALSGKLVPKLTASRQPKSIYDHQDKWVSTALFRCHGDLINEEGLHISLGLRQGRTDRTSIGRFLNLVWTLRGATVPKSIEENDVLTWNQENYGFHVIVPAREIPRGVQTLVDMIEKRRQTAKSLTTAGSVYPGCDDKLLRDPEARLRKSRTLMHKGLITAEEYRPAGTRSLTDGASK
jgi:hypothetical protein